MFLVLTRQEMKVKEKLKEGEMTSFETMIQSLCGIQVLTSGIEEDI